MQVNTYKEKHAFLIHIYLIMKSSLIIRLNLILHNNYNNNNNNNLNLYKRVFTLFLFNLLYIIINK